MSGAAYNPKRGQPAGGTTPPAVRPTTIAASDSSESNNPNQISATSNSPEELMSIIKTQSEQMAALLKLVGGGGMNHGNTPASDAQRINQNITNYSTQFNVATRLPIPVTFCCYKEHLVVPGYRDDSTNQYKPAPFKDEQGREQPIEFKRVLYLPYNDPIDGASKRPHAVFHAQYQEEVDFLMGNKKAYNYEYFLGMHSAKNKVEDFQAKATISQIVNSYPIGELHQKYAEYIGDNNFDSTDIAGMRDKIKIAMLEAGANPSGESDRVAAMYANASVQGGVTVLSSGR